MRRCLLALFAVFLLAQFSWAAAANYCGHEAVPDPSATHFGHHAPGHDEWEAPNAQDDPSVSATTDMDHGHCHLGHAAAAQPSVQGLKNRSGLQPSTAPPCLTESFVPEALDRPNWLRA